MKGDPPTLALLLAAALVILLPAAVTAVPSLQPGNSTSSATSARLFPNTSWALGVVVPEGAPLAGGGTVRWEGADNLTAAFTLPYLTMPDRVVYAVLSVMTGDGCVLQAAAGMGANGSVWLAYSWSIPAVGSAPNYHWVLNASAPEMAPGANVFVSIYRSGAGWNLRIVDEDTKAEVGRTFPPGMSPTLMAGDQEVFSLESYSRLGTTFRGMGNLTLRSILVDGERVAGGEYSYSEWDPGHNPLFIVGSSGSSPPAFISLGEARDGSFVWGYELAWGTGTGSLTAIVETLVLLLVPLASALGAVLWRTRRQHVGLPNSEKRLT